MRFQRKSGGHRQTAEATLTPRKQVIASINTESAMQLGESIIAVRKPDTVADHSRAPI
jgi:hypothetical protein